MRRQYANLETKGEKVMAEVHYLISDASKKVDVESHVLRYWEDELELDVPTIRNIISAYFAR